MGRINMYSIEVSRKSISMGHARALRMVTFLIILASLLNVTDQQYLINQFITSKNYKHYVYLHKK